MNSFQHDDDRQLDANLRALGRAAAQPADPSDEQLDRWMKIASGQALPVPTRRTRRPLLKKVLSWGAVAAVLVLGVTLAIQMAAPQQASADKIIARLSQNLSQNSGFQFRLTRLVVDNHEIDLRLWADKDGENSYAEFVSRPQGAAVQAPTEIDLKCAQVGNRAWLLIRRLTINGNEPLRTLLPANGALLICWPVWSEGPERTTILPIRVGVDDVSAAIASLGIAATDLSQSRLENGQVQIDGTLTNLQAMNLDSLSKAMDMTNLAAAFASQPAGSDTNRKELMLMAGMLVKAVFESKLQGKERADAYDYVDAFVNSGDLQAQLKKAFADLQQNPSLMRGPKKLLADARFQLAYDPVQSQISRLDVEGANPDFGGVNILFSSDGFDRTLLDERKFSADKNVRVMIHDDFLAAVIECCYRGVKPQTTTKESTHEK